MKIKIATFNVNSIKARLNNVKDWLKESNVDVALLQELKCEEDKFPFEEMLDLGYNAAVLGQKTYNGVAILSKFPIEDVVKGLPGFEADLGVKNKASNADLFGEEAAKQQQARYIEGVISVPNGKALRVASIYVPNGGGELENGQNLEESRKFRYKMDFFDGLRAHFANLLEFEEVTILGGDFNVANHEIDVFDAKNLAGTVCFHDDERRKFWNLLNLGLVDCWRAANLDEQAFSWWDYRGGAWQYNKGMRIDYLLASPLAADLVAGCEMADKGVRDREKASDHCPVVVELEV